jgi:CBS domain-containing protein
MSDTKTGRTVGEMMTRDPIVVRADAPLVEAAQLLDRHRISGLPVVDGTGALVGVVSHTDLLRARTTEHLWANWPGLAVRHLMTSPALSVGPDATVAEAAHLMERDHVHRLIVVGEDGRTPIGIIATADLVHAMAEERSNG